MSNYIKYIRDILPSSEINMIEETANAVSFIIDGYEIEVDKITLEKNKIKKTDRLGKYIAFLKNAQKVIDLYGDRFTLDFNTYKTLRENILVYDNLLNEEFEINFGNFSRGGLPKHIRAEVERSKNYENFIKKSNDIHNSFYSYDKVAYKNNEEKVIITCPNHGDFLQTPHDHSDGHGCPECKRQKKMMSFDEFLVKAREIHGDKFEYFKDGWSGASGKVLAKCPYHGDITLDVSSHLDGSDCLLCARSSVTSELKDVLPKVYGDMEYRIISGPDYLISKSKCVCNCSKHGNYETAFWKFVENTYSGCPECKNSKVVKTYQEFLDEANSVHNNKYKYIKESYTSRNGTIEIICPDHGLFTMNVYNHLIGQGCRECGMITAANSKRISPEDFISRVKSIFSDLDFSESKYIGSEYPITARCPEHGYFTRNAKVLSQGFGCPKCRMNKKEREIYNVLIEVYDGEIIFGKRYKDLLGKELDFYIPEFNFAIEYNGTPFHHSTPDTLDPFYSNTTKDKNYHHDKWKLCQEVGINLLSIPDFYWEDLHKQEIIKSKIRHYLKMDRRIYARKCSIVEIENSFANDFYNRTHIEGAGFSYKNSKSFGLSYECSIVMCVTIGEIYNQSSKSWDFKVSRISTELDITVVGGLSKLIKHLKDIYSSFKYQYTTLFGGSTFSNFESRYIGPRYFWVNPETLEYYHRNHCQKSLLEKNFKEPLLEEDTESSYMSRLGYLRYYDSGIYEIKI